MTWPTLTSGKRLTIGRVIMLPWSKDHHVICFIGLTIRPFNLLKQNDFQYRNVNRFPNHFILPSNKLPWGHLALSFLSPQRGSFWSLHPVWRNKNYFLSYRFLDTQVSRTKSTFNWKSLGVDKFLNILRFHIPCVKAIDGQGSCDAILCSRLSVDDSVLPFSDWPYIILRFDYQNSRFNVRILEL